jgi:hypothetical protein
MDIPTQKCHVMHANAVPETPTLIPSKWYLASVPKPYRHQNSNTKKSLYVEDGAHLSNNSLLAQLNHTRLETVHAHSGARLSNNFLERVAESVHSRSSVVIFIF